MAHYEPPHQDLRCLQIQLFSSLVVKELKNTTVRFLNALDCICATDATEMVSQYGNRVYSETECSALANRD